MGSQIGVTGLAVMGANLARNIARRGVPTAVHNRTTAKTEQFMADYGDLELWPSHRASLKLPKISENKSPYTKALDVLFTRLLDEGIDPWGKLLCEVWTEDCPAEMADIRIQEPIKPGESK